MSPWQYLRRGGRVPASQRPLDALGLDCGALPPGGQLAAAAATGIGGHGSAGGSKTWPSHAQGCSEICRYVFHAQERGSGPRQRANLEEQHPASTVLFDALMLENTRGRPWKTGKANTAQSVATTEPESVKEPSGPSLSLALKAFPLPKGKPKPDAAEALQWVLPLSGGRGSSAASTAGTSQDNGTPSDSE
mmetsp:Transcript_58503/g.161907  ORF Transcript_58503/g.161907 Transcript_58503/m.161907 type:complete len:191 (-) Transcript_58503:80-652(-)